MIISTKDLSLRMRLAIVFSIGVLASQVWPAPRSPDDARAEEARAADLRNQWTDASVTESIERFINAEAQWRALGDLSKASACVREIARLELLRGNARRAAELLEADLAFLNNGPDAENKAVTQSLVALFASLNGDEKRANILIRNALSVSVRLHKSIAEIHLNAAEIFENANRFRVAVEHYQLALDASRQAGDRRLEVAALIGLSFVEVGNGEPILGLEHAREAETKAIEANDKRAVAISRIAKGHLLNITGQKQMALNSYLDSLALFPAKIDSFHRANLYNGLGYTYENLSEWQLSLNFRQKAFAIFEREGRLFGKLATLPSLIKLSFATDNPEAAFEYLSIIESLCRRPSDKFWLAVAEKQIADHYFGISSFATARTYYERALPALTGAALKVEVALINERLGLIAENEGDTIRARALYETSIITSRSISNKMAEASTLFALARLSLQEGKTEEALRLSQESIGVSELISVDVANSRLRKTYFSSIFDRYQLLVAALMRTRERNTDERYSVEAFNAIERARARAMLEDLALSEVEFTADADPEAVKKEKEIRVMLNTKSDKLTDLLSRGAEKAEIDRLDSEINELQHQLEELKADLKQRSPVYSAIKDSSPFDLLDFQANVLDEDSVLLEFSLGKEDSYLWLIGKSEFEAYVLLPREEIESRVEILRGLISDREPRPSEAIEVYQARVAESDSRYRIVAAKLSSMLLGQAADRLKGKRLIVVADGGLHYFPISALPMPNSGSDQPIVMTNEVIYQPSAQTLSMLKKLRPASGQTARRDLLLFSDPVFSASDERLSGVELAAADTNGSTGNNFRFVESLDSLGRLRGSATEAASILKILGSSNADAFDGFAASRERLLNTDLAAYKILHFATHGIANKVRPDLGGIVLSRFGENGQHQDEFVRLEDIYGMKLKAELVVLSACETGVGKELKGEGTMSLNNAFLQSGSRSVLASLWKVEDNATRELMAEFYKGIASGGLAPSDALRRAQMKLASMPQYSSPFYWAAFTLHGDARTPLTLSASRPIWPYAALILAALAAVALFARRRIRR